MCRLARRVGLRISAGAAPVLKSVWFPGEAAWGCRRCRHPKVPAGAERHGNIRTSVAGLSRECRVGVVAGDTPGVSGERW